VGLGMASGLQHRGLEDGTGSTVSRAKGAQRWCDLENDVGSTTL
jgi:hypothetical protein